jgi:hypothetical protein
MVRGRGFQPHKTSPSPQSETCAGYRRSAFSQPFGLGTISHFIALLFSSKATFFASKSSPSKALRLPHHQERSRDFAAPVVPLTHGFNISNPIGQSFPSGRLTFVIPTPVKQSYLISTSIISFTDKLARSFRSNSVSCFPARNSRLLIMTSETRTPTNESRWSHKSWGVMAIWRRPRMRSSPFSLSHRSSSLKENSQPQLGYLPNEVRVQKLGTDYRSASNLQPRIISTVGSTAHVSWTPLQSSPVFRTRIGETRTIAYLPRR